MPAKFGVHFTDFTTSTAAKTMVRLAPAAQKFIEAIELIVTGSGITAAADTQHEGGIFPLTTGGAGTAGSSPTPEKFQQTSAASGVTAGIQFSTEPTTYGAVGLVYFGFNQRGGLRWAVPRGEGVLGQLRRHQRRVWGEGPERGRWEGFRRDKLLGIRLK